MSQQVVIQCENNTSAIQTHELTVIYNLST